MAKEVRIIVHRGTHAIGGSCIEIASGQHRIIIDLGLPLMGENGAELDDKTLRIKSRENGILPDIEGLYQDQIPSVDAVLLSHAHIDHHGLLGYVHPGIPIYLSKGSSTLIEVGNIFYRDKTNLNNRRHFEHWKPFEIGPFKMTSYLMDHSAFHASGFLIRCQDRKIFYTGDLRAHGRKKQVFDNAIKHPVRNLNCLIMEGTTLGGNHSGYRDEEEIEKQLGEIFQKQEDISFVFTSGSNIDRLVSLYKACKSTGKTLVIDLYTAYVLQSLKRLNPKLPPHHGDNLRIYYMAGHARHLSDNNLVDVLYKFKGRKLEIDEIVDNRSNMVLKLPIHRGMEKIAANLGSETLNKARLIYSMWSGYIEKNPDIKAFCEKYSIPMTSIHTSGHAHLRDLQRLVEAWKPAAVIPVHTLAGDSFQDFFPNVVRLNDGTIYEIP